MIPCPDGPIEKAASDEQPPKNHGKTHVGGIEGEVSPPDQRPQCRPSDSFKPGMLADKRRQGRTEKIVCLDQELAGG
jgi:hypothetical protein